MVVERWFGLVQMNRTVSLKVVLNVDGRNRGTPSTGATTTV